MSWLRRRSVSVDQARQLIAGGAQLVDVRSAKEWNADHVAGATHIPLDRLERSLHELRHGTQIVTICHSGVRSAVAARRLRDHDHDAVTVRGGMIAWRRKEPR
ncbi:MAG: rhodanese-like domain-containing protein [Microbacteriaceae bacterium]|jgi:rhodanese-related sulfurtransferase